MSVKRVLITGHRGYIGSVMAPALRAGGYDVVGTDVGFYDEGTLVPDPVPIPNLDKDIRDIVTDDLRGFDAVVHLAALSNDPIGNLDRRWTHEINYAGAVRLAIKARAAGVPRFVFSSSCIMYGVSGAPVVNEQSSLAPRTAYARSKVAAEKAIASLATREFSPTFLRNGTVYGVSPRMRFDTVLNDLAGAAVARGRIVVQGDGSPWRPVVHVEDVVQAFAAVLAAPRDAVHGEAFNTGSDDVNIQVGALAREVGALIPGCEVEIAGSAAADMRSYRASFAKFAAAFPGVTFRTPAVGARQLVDAFARLPLTPASYQDGRFIRLAMLQRLLDEGRVDQSLRLAAVERVQ